MTIVEATAPLVHPVTGEVVDPASPLPVLAEFVADCENAQRSAKDALKKGRTVVRDRLIERRERTVVEGGWEITNRSGRSRAWDPSELEAVLTDLVEREVVPASSCVGIVSTEPKVSGTAALALMDRLSGDDRKALASCFEWEQGSPSVDVAQVQS